MGLLKALLFSLVGVSFCMADISGIVTDTGTTPIAGAVVQLEKGGQTATSGIDGSFILVISTAILPGNGKLLPNSLSARISGTILNMTIAERSAVEVTTFNLTGKAISIVRKSLDAGTNSIALPYCGAGIYLYKVKSGTSELFLKGNSVGGVSFGSAESSQGSSSNTLAKQAKSAAAINDVIAATKTGYLNYRCVQYNSDTAGIAIKMIASAGTVTDADGNVYQTVKIGNQVWTVENLRVTKYNDGSGVPFDTSTSTWNSATTPKYCFYNNTTNAESIKKFGALYNWYVVNPANPKKIAPTGWHVPSDAEWDTLQNYLIGKGYNWDATISGNKIAKSLATKTDWNTYSTIGTIGCDLTKNNSSGFSALPGGFRYFNGNFYHQSDHGYWWSATEDYLSSTYYRYLYCVIDNLYRFYLSKSCGFSVRLLRDN
jgi:uncharacterized protein (TIGR02145 family)